MYAEKGCLSIQYILSRQISQNAGAPSKIAHITTIDGDIIYEVSLPVQLNRPTKLNFTYIDSRNEVFLPKDIPFMTDQEYSETDLIVYHENRQRLPITKYRVQVALYIDMDGQRMQGPSFASTQTISKFRPCPVAWLQNTFSD